ncbi:GIY-YIG nuclease family protein [Lagierella massiliensis]|uniref:GIY-YIG nuclease family protein n=1 Tax=Lagierella massiliensis TaxID=1689303 RepID=UPI0006D7A1DB|nr:GIY-YIG nuclease family protein [Lagierella massiliensis]
MKNYYIYIMANKTNKTIYIGVTSNLIKRVWEHKNKLVDGFTKHYNVNKLVYYEETTDVNSAIAREKQLKGWNRAKKNKLIDSINPNWKDLYDDIL